MSTSSTSWECIAFDGQRVPHGENFVPGPDNCTACKCEKGEARFCRAALCQSPQDCKSFRITKSCCDFECLDDILPTINKNPKDIPSSDTGLRMVASAITAILSLALLLFLIHRLRQRKLRTAQHQYFEDQLDALGGFTPDSCRNNPCCHSAIYLSGNDHVDFFLDGHTPTFSPWKPPSYYMQPGDAPPPYSEVIANDRARAEGPLPSLNPIMVRLNNPIEPAQQGANQRLKETHRHLVSSLPDYFSSQSRAETRVVRESGASSLTPALLSDQTYAVSSTSGGRTRPRSLHNPPIDPLNDLNKGVAESSLRSPASVSHLAQAESLLSGVKGSSDCKHDCPQVEKCNVCSITTQGSTSQDRPHVSRARQKVPPYMYASEADRNSAAAVIEEFRLRFRPDVSSSSTTPVEETPLSLSVSTSLASTFSISPRTSEDPPTTETSAEDKC